MMNVFPQSRAYREWGKAIKNGTPNPYPTHSRKRVPTYGPAYEGPKVLSPYVVAARDTM